MGNNIHVSLAHTSLILTQIQILVSALLKCKIKEVYYDAILLSDHTPNSLVYCPNLSSDIPKWRFKTKWLADTGFVTFLDEQIKYYFETNTIETSGSIRWEAFKAFIRGQIINSTSSKAKETYKKTKSLEAQIKKLEDEYHQSGSQDAHQRLLLLRTQDNDISTTRALSSLLRLKQTFYDAVHYGYRATGNSSKNTPEYNRYINLTTRTSSGSICR